MFLTHYLLLSVTVTELKSHLSLFLPHGRTGTGPVRTPVRVTDIFRSLIDHFGKITDRINYPDVSWTIVLSTIFLGPGVIAARHTRHAHVVIPLLLSLRVRMPSSGSRRRRNQSNGASNQFTTAPYATLAVRVRDDHAEVAEKRNTTIAYSR